MSYGSQNYIKSLFRLNESFQENLSNSTSFQYGRYSKKKKKRPGRSDFIIDEAEVDEDTEEQEGRFSNLPKEWKVQ